MIFNDLHEDNEGEVDMTKVQKYLKADRQWPRSMRIAHAQWQLSVAKTKRDRTFWSLVLEALGSVA